MTNERQMKVQGGEDKKGWLEMSTTDRKIHQGLSSWWDTLNTDITIPRSVKMGVRSGPLERGTTYYAKLELEDGDWDEDTAEIVFRRTAGGDAIWRISRSSAQDFERRVARGDYKHLGFKQSRSDHLNLDQVFRVFFRLIYLEAVSTLSSV
jgi:hypothetical protein